VLTQGWFMLSLIPFRSPDLATAGQFTLGLLAMGGEESVDIGNLSAKLNLALCLSFVVLYHLSATDTGKRALSLLARTPAPIRGIAYGLAIVYLFLFKPLSEGAFIYAQF
jgi:hypothetical protein